LAAELRRGHSFHDLFGIFGLKRGVPAIEKACHLLFCYWRADLGLLGRWAGRESAKIDAMKSLPVFILQF
jgi:hypothetical protein